MKRLIACALFLMLACGGSDGPTGPDDGTGTIRIINSSAVALVEVNISRCDVAFWGANRIATPIDLGQSRDFALTPNCYDVRVIGSTNGEVQFYDLTLAGNTVLPITIFSD